MEKKIYGHFEKRQAVKVLLEQGKLSKADIAKRVGCSKWLVYDVSRELNPVDQDKVVEEYVTTLDHEGQKYVSRQWLVTHLGLTPSTISRHLQQKKITFIERIRLPYKVPARFFLLEEIWKKLPKWKLRYEENSKNSFRNQSTDRHLFRDISDAQYHLLCSLMEWWIAKLYWPSAEDLLTLPVIQSFFHQAEDIRHHLRELQSRGYLTRLGPQVSRGARSLNRAFQIHRGPKNLTTLLVHCPKCRVPYRIAQPFFVPKTKTPK
ncbi:hypothetical protein KKC06_02545 [Patescibacteria group bacterium]|nr:hypothetical protein [Patescibacteria group bacterium]